MTSVRIIGAGLAKTDGGTLVSALGFLLVGASGVLAYHIFTKLRVAGDRSHSSYSLPITLLWVLPQAYLRLRREQNWSPWPAYMMLITMISGLILFVVGLTRS